jgi:hypothetical protein
MEVNYPGRFASWKNSGGHWVEACVGPRAGLDGSGEQDVSYPIAVRTQQDVSYPIAVRTQHALNKLSKLYIHDNNKCIFYVYRYNLISLLHVSTSRHSRWAETCSTDIRLYLCVCVCVYIYMYIYIYTHTRIHIHKVHLLVSRINSLTQSKCMGVNKAKNL